MYDAIEIVLPGETFRLTTAARDVVVDGKDYVRADVRLEVSDHEAVISLVGEHRLSQRASDGGVRPQQADVNVVRLEDNGEVVLRWIGHVVSLGVADTHVEFYAESALSQALRRPVGLMVSRSCPHRLFDAGCRLDRNAFSRRAIVVAIEHRTLLLDTSLAPHWASGGELTHVVSGERIEIVEQLESSGAAGSRITLHSRPYNTRVGDAVEVTPGCDRAIFTCHTKFNNRQNFGGFPHLPTKNAFEAE